MCHIGLLAQFIVGHNILRATFSLFVVLEKHWQTSKCQCQNITFAQWPVPDSTNLVC